MADRPEGVELYLSVPDAEALHAGLEDLLENGRGGPELEKIYRVLGWRILATRPGVGLTGSMADLARSAGSVEEYEAERDRELGPILDGLERGDNRDP